MSLYGIDTLNEALSYLVKSDSDINDVTIKLNDNICNCLKTLNSTFESIIDNSHSQKLKFDVCQSDGVHWRFICTSCHVILLLSDSLKLDANHILSVSQQKNIRSILQFIVTFGVLPSLIPGVGLPRRDPQVKNLPETLTENLKYNRLNAVCNFLNELLYQDDLKTILYANYFGDYLAALLQLCYAPIAKPNTTVIHNNETFTMSDTLWIQLQTDRKKFQSNLNFIISSIYRPILIKELIILQGNQDPAPPNFMKRALSKHLSNLLISPDGVHSVMQCFLDSNAIDIGAQWKHIDLITRLISVKHGSLSEEEYLSNICSQLRDLLSRNPNKDFVIVAAACVTSLHKRYNPSKSIDNLINSIITPLMFKNISQHSPESIIMSSTEIDKIIATLDLCFSHQKLSLPSHFLTPIVKTLFCIRIVTIKNSLLANKLNNLIMREFKSHLSDKDNWFSSLIFEDNDENILTLRNVLFTASDEGPIAKLTNNTCYSPSIESSVNCFLEMIIELPEGNTLACNFFIFLLSVLSKSKSHVSSLKTDFKLKNELHDTCNIELASEKYLIITKTLENLAGMECVLNNFKNDPSFIVKFIVDYLEECVSNLRENNEHLIHEDCVNICLILLSTLLTDNLHNGNLKQSLTSIEKSTNFLLNESTNPATKLLSKEVYDTLCPKSSKITKNVSRFEEAIGEVCDSLLPIRAHGLMHLAKLLEEKDAETISKKHFIMCVFQENLKDEDSYIYLTAINGLVSLAKYCTEDVIEILSKEFLSQPNKSSFAKEDDNSIMLRMKIGEVLVKVTKHLGDSAEDHKSILLNTFLCGCRDPDDLIRASSLSNIAELFHVLSYKLGSIIFEILSCMQEIIQSDKSPECRRASVMAISSLIKGLGKESLFFLKEALLPIYRTLKQLYKDEQEDTTVKLHAQIALEELNCIMLDLLTLK